MITPFTEAFTEAKRAVLKASIPFAAAMMAAHSAGVAFLQRMKETIK